MRPIRGKKAAIELSMTTIIVVVLSLTLLIMGFVFIRSIMCGAIGVTEDIGSKVDKEVERLFATSSGEINCIGSEGDPVSMTPGKNVIHCIISSERGGKYRIGIESVTWTSNDPTGILRSIDIKDEWVTQSGDEYDIAPGDETAYKPIILDIPDDAPEADFRVKLQVTKDLGRAVTGSKELDFRVTRTGVIRNTLC